MKVILYMAVTANGLVASPKDEVGFVSENEWKSFSNMTNKIGNMVIGRRTFELMKKESEFKKFKKVKIVVVSREKFTNNGVMVVNSPKSALNFLQKKKFKTVLVAGGGKINASFMALGLVDEIFLDVMPAMLGKGIPLFNGENF
ncbi:MAG: dihydrofolate reductase, partial [Candidatus Diapherotrites archaeon]|nr:dihydrofolate reductase [Candidatus Diapherotrites archaeon]